MCEYCKNAATGDDWFSFAEKKVDIGHLGVLVMEASIEKENIVTGDPVLVLYLTHQAGDCQGSLNETSKIKISYCPMCGRKL